MTSFVTCLLVTSSCLGGVLVVHGASTSWRDVCKWQSFDADCDADAVIVIDQAMFGRMRLGSCLAEDYGHVGCFSDVRRLMERRCAGRHRCHVQLPDVQLDRSPHGCPPDLLAYLEVEYHCQTVTVMADVNCTTGRQVPVTSSHGFLASVITEQTQLGSAECPWLITAHHRQTISVYLHDFGVWRYNASAVQQTGAGGDDVCVIYAELSGQVTADSQHHKQVLVCGRQSGHRLVYSSSTENQLSVTVHASPSSPHPVYFLLEFDVGCADYDLPKDAYQLDDGRHDASGDVTLRVACIHDNTTSWEVTCHKGRWTTQPEAVVDCTHARSTAVRDASSAVRVAAASSTNQGVLIIVVIGSALLLSILIIAAGVIYLRRKARYEVAAAVDDIYGATHGKYCGPLAVTSNSLSASYSSVLGGYHDVMPIYDHQRHVINNNNNNNDRDYATTLQIRQTVPPLAAASCGELWTCPVHGRVLRLMPQRRAWRAADQLYDIAARLDTVHEDSSTGRAPDSVDTGRSTSSSARAAASREDREFTSPFYHELEPTTLDSCVTPCY